MNRDQIDEWLLADLESSPTPPQRRRALTHTASRRQDQVRKRLLPVRDVGDHPYPLRYRLSAGRWLLANHTELIDLRMPARSRDLADAMNVHAAFPSQGGQRIPA